MKLIKVKVGKRLFRIKDCKGLSSLRGLMFDDMKTYDGALIYANNIWMPFVKEKLNIVFLDKDMKVLRQEIAVPLSFDSKSWKIYAHSGAKYCLELKDIDVGIKSGTRIKML